MRRHNGPIARAAVPAAVLLAAGGFLFLARGEDPPARETGAESPKQPPVKVERDVTYREIGDTKLQVDLALPPGDGPFPAVLCVHGGGWRAGHRRDLSTPSKFFNGGSFIEMVAREGYVAVSVSYRLSTVAKFPAQIEDCKTAVRWLRANAEKYRVNPERIACVGFSAGGHLSSLLGTAGKGDGFEGPDYAADSSEVCAVVNFFGPTDLTDFGGGPLEEPLLVPWLGATFKDKPELYRRASPISYADKGDAPTLFIHGDKDTLVPLEQSRKLLKALKDAGVQAELLVMEGEGHGWVGEKADVSARAMFKFLAEHLKK